MRAALARWVALWGAREDARPLAIVRIGVGLVMLGDFVQVFRLDLVEALWAPTEQGGIGPASVSVPVAPVYELFGASSALAHILFGVACSTAASLALGFYSRSSALVLLLISSQLALLSPDGDRGIDTLLRNALMVLACSGAGATWSIDARRRHGYIAPEVTISAWPRYLLVLQLVLLYFTAGVLKQSPAWTALDGYSALYIVLSMPHYARVSLPHDLPLAVYSLLQLATIITLVFERTAIFLPWLLWLRETQDRAGALRRWVNKLHLLEVWAGTGIAFHLGLALSVNLGIFPWGCLALYPALITPRAPAPRSTPEGSTPALRVEPEQVTG